MPEKTVTILAGIGDRVWIPDLELHAVILSISISRHGTQYEVAWFSNGSRESDFLFPHEFRVGGKP